MLQRERTQVRAVTAAARRASLHFQHVPFPEIVACRVQHPRPRAQCLAVAVDAMCRSSCGSRDRSADGLSEPHRLGRCQP